jgi:hypothetical protein
MGMRVTILVLTAGGAMAGARLLAADDASFSKDLMATIALQGMPCDQLIDSKRNGDSDYTATCKDGNRYHIYVNAQGRVIVQKLTGK